VSQAILLDTGPFWIGNQSKMVRTQHGVHDLVAKPQNKPCPHSGSGNRRLRIEAGTHPSRKNKGLAKLDALITYLEYLPLNTPTMRKAAEFWATARKRGQPTAGENTIDVDVTLSAQAVSVNTGDVVVATTNVDHLNRFVKAEKWQDITLN